jgi:hypothetical protein
VPAPAPAPRTVRLRIATNPEDAELLLDGEAVGNPYDADVPKGGKHRLRATAPGHRSRELTVAFDRDRSVALRLDKVAAPKPKAAAKPRPTTPRATSVSSTPSSSKGAGFVTESPY